MSESAQYVLPHLQVGTMSHTAPEMLRSGYMSVVRPQSSNEQLHSVLLRVENGVIHCVQYLHSALRPAEPAQDKLCQLLAAPTAPCSSDCHVSQMWVTCLYINGCED